MKSRTLVHAWQTDYGLQKYVDFAPNPNQSLELRKFNFRMRRA